MVSDYYMSLTRLTARLIHYELPLVILIGSIGNIMNIILFSRRNMRKNSCSMYFICLSAVNLLFLISHALPRTIAVIFKLDALDRINSYCKARSYFLTISMILARHFICLIAIDRWLISSSNAFVRRQSSTRFAKWIIIISITFWSIFSIHAPLGFSATLWGCSPLPKTTYTVFHLLYNIITSLLTLIILSIFNFLTVCNVRSSIRRSLHPNDSNASVSGPHRPCVVALRQFHHCRSKRETQLIRLSVAQVVVFIVLYSVWAVFPLMVFLADLSGHFVYGSDIEGTISFVGTVGMHLLYTYASSTFILYTLASNVFRREFFQSIKNISNFFYD